MYELCCIGHITSDRIVTPHSVTHLPGGTAYYFSHAVRNMGIAYRLVTAVGDAEKQYVADLAALGIDVQVLPSEHTVCFENSYGEDQDHRTQKVSRKADPFRASDFSAINAAIFHLGPLLADDMPAQLIRELSGKARISLDVQGFLREVVEEDVRAIDWQQKKELLPFVHYLKANEDEAKVLTGYSDPRRSAQVLAQWGVKEVILTLGSKGSLIFSDGIFYQIPAYRPPVLTDATGCGDTYMAGYLSRRCKENDIQSSGEFAAAMATWKIRSSGAFSGSLNDVQYVMDTYAHS
ncbi:PfkB family carbohydrate kinase [Sediminibacterium soli]|uniref:PfkB family carbohydrate kinase n=1 Tax=Sediminibacterium soli TaxID=2698829 RepID=UPI001379537A|nr:PfkB family carbohydrate kinase [Sediminibacterium soli]NCI47968.1 ribokinase [Sediminibacterium soli]